jgi:hypothetical protein
MMLQKALGAGLCLAMCSSGAAPQPWRQTFSVDVKELATQGENPYFILKPGYQATFEGKESGKPGKLVITVLNETRTVVNTRSMHPVSDW